MRQERGNILFLILLAVILFAALSYAVTSSMRGGGNNAGKESVQVQASSILNLLDQISVATMRMTLTGGIKPENISFAYNYKAYDGTVTLGGFNNSSCIPNDCRMFHPAGGGVSPVTFETYTPSAPTGITTGSTMPGYYQILMIQFPYAGTALNDVVIRVVYLMPEICDEIAARLSLPTDSVINGTYLSASNTANWDTAGYTVTSAHEPLMGKNTMVTYHGSGTGRYCHVHRMLIAR